MIHQPPQRRCAQLRRARKRNAGGRFTAGEWREIKAQYKYTCLCCGLSEPEIKLRYDLAYLNNWSFGLDLSILLRTLPVILTRRGI